MRILTKARSVIGLLWLPITVVAGGVLALTHPTELTASVVASVTALAPLVALLGAIYGPPPRRAMRGGFAATAGSYFLLCMVCGFEPTDYPRPFVSSLLTTRAVNFLFEHMFPHSTAYPGVNGGVSSGFGGFGGSNTNNPPGGAFDVGDNGDFKKLNDLVDSQVGTDPKQPSNLTLHFTDVQTVQSSAVAYETDDEQYADFHVIGQSLWAWILGWLGGLLAKFFSWRARKAQAETTAAVAAPPQQRAEPVAPQSA